MINVQRPFFGTLGSLERDVLEVKLGSTILGKLVSLALLFI